MTKYSYLSSIDFINQLDFDYIETFSFQRGADYKELEKKGSKELEKLSRRKEKRDNLSESETSLLKKLTLRHGFTQYLINSEGEFHTSAEKTGAFQKEDPEGVKLFKILSTPIKEVPGFMCAPTYRDAIVFYNSQNEITATLNVCLSCEYMEIKMLHHINADTHTYSLMKEFFAELGHKVNEE